MLVGLLFVGLKNNTNNVINTNSPGLTLKEGKKEENINEALNTLSFTAI